jgi:hypothetical protein
MATVIDAGRRVFSNLKYLYFTPWEDESTLGNVTYDLVNIVGDTTSSEQDENEVNELTHEFSNEPLYENINLGKKNFATECIDFQNDVVKQLFGWTVDVNGNAFAPIVYKPLYCKIEMGFNSTEDIIVLPKVKLNSRAVITSMKTDAARGNITGTCYSAYITAGSTTKETDMSIVTAAHASSYTVSASGADSTEASELKVSATAISATTVSLTATGAPSGFTTYIWTVNGVEQESKTTSLSVTTTADTQYEISVRATDGNGKFTSTASVKVLTPKSA